MVLQDVREDLGSIWTPYSEGSETLLLPFWHPSYGSNPATYISKDRNAYPFTRTAGTWGKYGWIAAGTGGNGFTSAQATAPSGAFTIIVWFKGQPTNEDALVSFGADWFLSLESNTLIELRCGASSNYRRWAPTIGANWRHLVVTLPGSAQTDVNNATATLDGVLLSASATVAGAAQGVRSTIKIGDESTDTRPATQTFGEIYVYPRVLSTSVRHYQNTQWRFKS